MFHVSGRLLIVIAAGAFLSWLVTACVKGLAPRMGLLDRPNERSSHSTVTPRAGGLGFVLVWMFGCLAFLGLDNGHQLNHLSFGTYMATALAVSGISLRDDISSVSPLKRFAVHLGAGLVIVTTCGPFQVIDLGWSLSLGHFGGVITILWIVGLTNAFNFMDGIDGIAGLQAVVAAFAWCLAGAIVGSPFISGISGVLAGAGIGFLVHNWSPARIFMGDVGSAFLGFHFAIISLFLRSDLNEDVIWSLRLPLFAMAVVWPFVWDSGFTFLRRLVRREKVWEPHRSHLYQRMVQAGWRHAWVASYYGGWATACSLAAIHYLRFGALLYVCAVAGLYAGATVLLVMRLETNLLKLSK